MATFKIEGGHLLSGTITPQGAKNEALQVICATLLTSEEVIIKNIPDIRDVNNLIQLLKDIGVKVKEDSRGRNGERTYSFQASDLNLEYLGSDEFVKKCAALRGGGRSRAWFRRDLSPPPSRTTTRRPAARAPCPCRRGAGTCI